MSCCSHFLIFSIEIIVILLFFCLFDFFWQEKFITADILVYVRVFYDCALPLHLMFICYISVEK